MGDESEEYLRKHTVGELKPLTTRIRLAEYDPEWPLQYHTESERIRGALGERALRVEHVGSTAVPGLPSKPVLDIVLAVTDSASEDDYSPALEQAGYKLRIREPGWYEHRLFQGQASAVNLHVFSAGCAEIDRMLAFRDWLRTNSGDRELYAECKRTLAQREWKHMQDYADAKTAVIQQIMSRAQAAWNAPAAPEADAKQRELRQDARHTRR